MNNKEFTEEMKTQLVDRMNRLMSASDFLCKECIEDVKFLLSTSLEFEYSPTKEMGDLLATLGVTKLFIEIWKKYFEVDFLKDTKSPVYTLMHDILWVLCNSMESSTALCVQVLESDLHKVVLNYLKTDYLDPSKTVNPYYEDAVFGLVAILHNMLQNVPESSQSLREQKALDVFQRFRRSPSNKIACLALIMQGYIITEEESESVNANDSNFIFLKHVLDRALMSTGRRAYGFLPIEVISALNRLAVNDKNKKRIVRVGLLSVYVMLLQPECSEDEQEAAAEGLWTLSFKCTCEIENEPGCVDALKKLATVNSERLKRPAEGVLWTLEESKRKKYISSAGQEGQRHVFISYQWDSKEPMIEKLVNSLKTEGFEVWVDLDNVSETKLDAMARAVEEAAVVIVCLSEKYKESPNCRTEAECASRLRKEIIPLQLQSHYQPDGWLEDLVGNRRMHDFTSDEKYSESIKILIGELGVKGKTTEYEVGEPNSNVDKVTKVSVPTTPTTGLSGGDISEYENWSSEDIVSWLNDNKLEKFQDWFKDFDGTRLSEYKGMLESAPDVFYSVLEEEKFSDIDMLKLSKALEQL